MLQSTARAPLACINVPVTGAVRDQQQQSAGHSQILHEKNRLHLIAEIGMEDIRTKHVEVRQQEDTDACLRADQEGDSGADFQCNHQG
jgi:hypothetical protein